MKRTLRVCAIVLLLHSIGLFVSEARAQAYPVLFAHGFCSDSSTFEVMTRALMTIDPPRFGSTVTRLYSDSIDVWVQGPNGPRRSREIFPTVDPARKVFAIDFRSLQGSFDPFEVAQVPIGAKAVELRQVIDEIKRISGQPKVHVVGHSMGGLVARSYIQVGGGAVGYQRDIAALVTIDTPHRGSILAAFDANQRAFTDCVLRPSTNKQELVPESATLRLLNGLPWPRDTPVAAIASWQTEFENNVRGDAVVTYESQNLLTVYPELAGAAVYLIDNPVSLGPARQLLHVSVHQLPSTIAFVNLIITLADRLSPSPLPGAPRLTSTTAGGIVTLQWTAAAIGGAPTGYVLRGTYRDPRGLVFPFEFPLGLLTSVNVPASSPAGTYVVRVFARNAAGESPPSNDVTFTVGDPRGGGIR